MLADTCYTEETEAPYFLTAHHFGQILHIPLPVTAQASLVSSALVRGLHPPASFQAAPGCPVGPTRALSQPHGRRGRAAAPAGAAHAYHRLAPSCTPELGAPSRPRPAARASSAARPGRAGPGAALTR